MKTFYKLLIGLSLLALPAFSASIPVTSVGLNTGGSWYGFYWQGNGLQAFGNEVTYTADAGTVVMATSPSGGPDVVAWSVSVPTGQTFILTLTDLYTAGDTFSVYDNSVLLSGTVNSPANPGTQCDGTLSNDPAVCLVNSNFYHGVFSLGAGTNVITIYDVLSAPSTYNGSAAFELTQGPSVPEPTTLSLMGLGLAGLFLGRRAKRV